MNGPMTRSVFRDTFFSTLLLWLDACQLLGVACGGVGLFFDVSAVWQRVSDPRGVRSVKFLSSQSQTKETDYFIGWDQHSPVPCPPPSPWKRKHPLWVQMTPVLSWWERETVIAVMMDSALLSSSCPSRFNFRRLLTTKIMCLLGKVKNSPWRLKLDKGGEKKDTLKENWLVDHHDCWIKLRTVPWNNQESVHFLTYCVFWFVRLKAKAAKLYRRSMVATVQERVRQK